MCMLMGVHPWHSSTVRQCFGSLAVNITLFLQIFHNIHTFLYILQVGYQNNYIVNSGTRYIKQGLRIAEDSRVTQCFSYKTSSGSRNSRRGTNPKGGYCHGMTESVKVHRKDQSVKDFTSKCLFLLFCVIL